MIRIHAIQTGIVQVKRAFIRGSVQAGGMFPFLGQLFTDSQTVDLPVYAWAIEHPEGVIVVDTGEIAATKINWITQSRFAIQPEEEIGPQLARLNITNRDIRQVVLTHWHGDHIGGRGYFQAEQVYLSETEYQYARQFPMRLLVPFPADYHPQPLAFQPEPVGPFTHSFPLTSDGAVIAVPTPGHTPGHLSVIVRDQDIHYFLAGDMSYTEQALLEQQRQGPSAAPVEHSQTLKRVLQYAQVTPTVYLPAHDPAAGERLVRQQVIPVTAFAAA